MCCKNEIKFCLLLQANVVAELESADQQCISHYYRELKQCCPAPALIFKLSLNWEEKMNFYEYSNVYLNDLKILNICILNTDKYTKGAHYPMLVQHGVTSPLAFKTKINGLEIISMFILLSIARLIDECCCLGVS